ncbi:hypothetical protein BJX62DRAFT_232363 [Aspergillus germanicus]
MRAPMVLLAIWVALLATFAMALPDFDTELKINVTITKADLTRNPGGYTQADIRGIKAGIRELDKLDGFRPLEGKHCEWAACGMSAAIWWFPPLSLFLPLRL